MMINNNIPIFNNNKNNKQLNLLNHKNEFVGSKIMDLKAIKR